MTFSYITKDGASKNFDATDKNTGLATLKTFADRDPNTGIMEVKAPAPIAPTAPPAVTSSDELRNRQKSDITDQAKEDAENATTLSRLKVQKELTDLRASLAPEGILAPTRPDLEGSYRKLRNEEDASGNSIDEYQGQLIEITGKKAKIKEDLDAFRKNAPQGQNQASFLGQLSEREQNAQDQMDSLNLEASVLTQQISNRNDVIQSIMGYKKEDYNTAAAEYDKEFSKNISMLNFVTARQDKEAATAERGEDNARANLQIIQSNIKSGNVAYDNLDPMMRTTIETLELQAGLPKGFTKYITENVKGDVLATTSRTGDDGSTYYDVLTRDPDGSLKTTSIFRGASEVAADEEEPKRIQSFQADVASAILRIDQDPAAYAAEFRALKAKYPEASDQLINAKLGAQP